MAKSPPKKKASGKAGGKPSAKKAAVQKSGAVKSQKQKSGSKAPPVVLPNPLLPAMPVASRKTRKLLRKTGKKSWWKRLLKWGVVVAFLIIALPVALTFLYASSSVRPVSTLMIAERLQAKPAKRIWVHFDEIAPVAWQSVMMSEDGQFCAHHGVDWQQAKLVIDDALEGEKVRGASTITMQVVKNIYLWPSRSVLRKILEVPLALFVDLIWSKKRIMEVYLNIAEWGPGIFGIEAAAQHHFGRSAKRLSSSQAALLAVTLPNPEVRNPRRPGRGMKRLAQLVQGRAKASGAYIGCLRD